MTDTNYLYEYFLEKSGEIKKPDTQKNIKHAIKRINLKPQEKEGKEHV